MGSLDYRFLNFPISQDCNHQECAIDELKTVVWTVHSWWTWILVTSVSTERSVCVDLSWCWGTTTTLKPLQQPSTQMDGYTPVCVINFSVLVHRVPKFVTSLASITSNSVCSSWISKKKFSILFTTTLIMIMPYCGWGNVSDSFTDK